MRGYGILICISVSVAVSSCDRGPCDQNKMLAVINKDIRSENGNPENFKLAEVKTRPDGVYVGMSVNHSPTYRRHYLIDPGTCKIIDARYDQ